MTANDYGIVQFYIDDNKPGHEIDNYSPEVSMTKELILGQIDLEQGFHVIEIEIIAKNSKSSAFMFGLDYLKVDLLDG